MAGFSDAPFAEALAVPAVCVLTAFLSYFSQFVFSDETLDPGPLTRNESVVFNTLLLCLWFSYFRAVTIDPGRFIFEEQVLDADGRWCKKCQAPKPPRAHHCRHCRRCIPKMDHHCPWTANCVSMTTFPHFLRFLVYANVSLWTLGYFFWQRFYALWETRHMPAHLGPSLFALISLAMTSLVWAVTSLALGLMLITTLQGWVLNRTTIEDMEVDKHESNIRSGNKEWWDITGPDGEKLRFEHIEFPYDVGFFANMAQAMGSSNPLLWLFPLAGNPRLSKTGTGPGWTWDENGFNRKFGMWPPPDPEKLRRAGREGGLARRNFDTELQDAGLSPEEQVEAFRRRQEEDFRRKNKIMAELEEVDDYYGSDGERDSDEGSYRNGWVNADGERLRDYGVDEEAEQYDDEVPIAELLRRRKGATSYNDE
ncbi:DHHC palmitoyltransferase domain-containing protein [Trichoderma breve]|uniref:Palmitoyltransferase PFA4 n=1 Tax=Trichoderma breve TaxID=2034170 RepID=A0A9W9E9S3_9HYPO|nr:DHHC palmitoyltransferase domain-containing protein [Trichoderma breve]KAJ4862417.1 DHHC palmitoyltransferase domain-containing protein [Trichoderma breve]